MKWHASCRPLWASIALAAVAALTSAPSWGQKMYGPGVTDSEIKIGQTMPYSGPASAYGTIGKVEAAYFKMINDQGGVNGRKINMISLDDSYSPPRTVEQVRKLVEEENVLLLFQTLGTPPNVAIHKYVNAKKVPHLFLATGSSLWDDPKNFPWTMGFNLGYQTEGHIYAKWLLLNSPDAKVAVLYQNDDFGKDLLKGFKDGLGAKAGKMIVSEATYEVTDPTIDSQILKLKDSGADTFLDITTPKFGAQATRKIYDSGWKPLHLLNNVAASIGTVIMPVGPEKALGARTVVYYKDASDPMWDNDPGMKEWRAFMAKYYPDGNLKDASNVYGYIAAQVMVQVLKQCGDNLTRENVMHQAASLKALKIAQLLPGMSINTSATDFSPIEQGQMARFDGTRWAVYGDILGK